VDMSLDQLWRDMQRDSVTINGELFRGDAGHGPERIVGALVRQILGVGIEPSESPPTDSVGDAATAPQPPKHHHRSDLQESQALAYARDVLLSGNRTRSGGDSYFCVNTLCQNPELVVIVPNSSTEPEPIAIDVREDETDIRVIEKSGWIKTRNKNQKEWRKMFFVLSEGTLSFYESALPRPHRLRGQIVVAESTISVSKIDHDFVLKLSKEGSLKIERLLSFTSADRLLDWTFALECSTRMKSAVTGSAKKINRRKLNKAGGGEASADAAKGDILTLAAHSTKEHAVNLGLDEEIVENRLALFSKRAAASMVISIRACTEYKVCTLDPTGEEDIDTWATIRAHFFQSFRLGGGANGRIMRGEEIVQISVAQKATTQDSPDRFGGTEQDPTSPSRRGQNRRIFRRFSTSEEVEEILKTSSID
jgi:PH domain